MQDTRALVRLSAAGCIWWAESLEGLGYVKVVVRGVTISQGPEPYGLDLGALWIHHPRML